jgi:hypothetical protein
MINDVADPLLTVLFEQMADDRDPIVAAGDCGAGAECNGPDAANGSLRQ